MFSSNHQKFEDKALLWVIASNIFFTMPQVTDNGVIMETDDEKISARIKMIDETEVTQSAQARNSLQALVTVCKHSFAGRTDVPKGDPKCAS